jgi:hypothetical protein
MILSMVVLVLLNGPERIRAGGGLPLPPRELYWFSDL